MSDTEKKASVYNLTTPVVMSYPQLLEAKPFMRKGKPVGDPKFNATFQFLLDSADLKAMKALCARVAKEKWPGRDLKTLAFPFQNGDNIADTAKATTDKKGNPKPSKDREFYRGHVVLKASSKYEPRLSGVENGIAVDYEGASLKAAAGKFYPGVQVLAQFNFVPYEGIDEKPDGVTAYLNMVFTTNKGVRMRSGQSAAEVFKGYVGSVSAEDPTGGAQEDDEIPF